MTEPNSGTPAQRTSREPGAVRSLEDGLSYPQYDAVLDAFGGAPRPASTATRAAFAALKGREADVAVDVFGDLLSSRNEARIDVNAHVDPADADDLWGEFYRDGMTPVEYCAAVIDAVISGDVWVLEVRLDTLSDDFGMFADADLTRIMIDPFVRAHGVDPSGPWYLAGDRGLFLDCVGNGVGLCVLYHGDLPGQPVGWSAHEP